MFEHFRTFLLDNGMGAMIGLMVWGLLYKVRPDRGRGWQRYADKRWWMMALLALTLFGGAALLEWNENRAYVAMALGVLTLLVVGGWIRRGWMSLSEAD